MHTRRNRNSSPLDPWLLGIVRHPSLRPQATPTPRLGRSPIRLVTDQDVTAEAPRHDELWLWAGRGPRDMEAGWEQL